VEFNCLNVQDICIELCLQDEVGAIVGWENNVIVYTVHYDIVFLSYNGTYFILYTVQCTLLM